MIIISMSLRDAAPRERLVWNGRLAQLGEHLPYKQGVTGSSPVLSTIFGPVVQSVSTPACHAGGRQFESVPGRHNQEARVHRSRLDYASVAQLVEQWTENPRVVGSTPTGGTNNAGVAHPVERHLAKVEVASSSLVTRSKQKRIAKNDSLFIW